MPASSLSPQNIPYGGNSFRYAPDILHHRDKVLALLQGDVETNSGFFPTSDDRAPSRYDEKNYVLRGNRRASSIQLQSGIAILLKPSTMAMLRRPAAFAGQSEATIAASWVTMHTDRFRAKGYTLHPADYLFRPLDHYGLGYIVRPIDQENTEERIKAECAACLAYSSAQDLALGLYAISSAPSDLQPTLADTVVANFNLTPEAISSLLASGTHKDSLIKTAQAIRASSIRQRAVPWPDVMSHAQRQASIISDIYETAQSSIKVAYLHDNVSTTRFPESLITTIMDRLVEHSSGPLPQAIRKTMDDIKAKPTDLATAWLASVLKKPFGRPTDDSRQQIQAASNFLKSLELTILALVLRHVYYWPTPDFLALDRYIKSLEPEASISI